VIRFQATPTFAHRRAALSIASGLNMFKRGFKGRSVHISLSASPRLARSRWPTCPGCGDSSEPGIQQAGHILISDRSTIASSRRPPTYDRMSFGLGPNDFRTSDHRVNDAQRRRAIYSDRRVPVHRRGVIPQAPNGAVDNRVIL